jgi:hypothetical protein
MKKVRAKMTCISIDGTMVNFACRYDQMKSQEDNTFSEATPYGEAKYSISNQDAKGMFEVNKNYYFDITACEE